MSNPLPDRNTGYGGEQGAGFILGEAGYVIIDGPSGAAGHAANAHGPDGVAYHPITSDLIIYDEKDYLETVLDENDATGTKRLYRLQKLNKASALVKGLNLKWIERVLQTARRPDFPYPAALQRLELMADAIRLGTRIWPPQTRVAVVRWRGGVVEIGAELLQQNVVFVDLLTDPAILARRREHTWKEIWREYERIDQAIEMGENLHLRQYMAIHKWSLESTRDTLETINGMFGQAVHKAMNIPMPQLSIWAPAHDCLVQAKRAMGAGDPVLAIAHFSRARAQAALAQFQYQLWANRVWGSYQPMAWLIVGSAAALAAATIAALAAPGRVASGAVEAQVAKVRVELFTRVADEIVQKAQQAEVLEELQEFARTREREITRVMGL